jgi:catechol 2,3-dioxygenase-like lactoylglutathione lyase family enzyme
MFSLLLEGNAIIPRERCAVPFFTSFDHIALAMPVAQEDRARTFYVGILGFEEVPKPAELASRGGAWFRSGEALLHLGVETGFRPAKKAHPALRACDYGSLRKHLINNDIEILSEDRTGGQLHCYVCDPFGNRIEIVGDQDE